MSEENVEIVRRVYETSSATRRLDPAVVDENVEVDASQIGGGTVTRGRDEAEKTLRDYWETFEEFSIELEELIHADEGRVVTLSRHGGRIRGGEGDVWQRFFDVWTLSGGKIVRLSTHTDRTSALEAAGLSE